MAELVRWSALKEKMDAIDMQIVVVSPDTALESNTMKLKHDLKMTILTDTELKVADLYNVRHEKALVGARGPVRDIMIPARFLIGEDGTIRWMEVPNDARVRTDPNRVLNSATQALQAVQG